MRSSEPEPTTSKREVARRGVMRKSLDVVFSRLRPSIMNGGAYGLGRAAHEQSVPAGRVA